MSQNEADPKRLDPSQLAAHIDRLCDAFEAAWKAGQRQQIENFLSRSPDVGRKDVFRELLLVELQSRQAGREAPRKTEYISRFPEFAAEINLAFGTNPAASPPRASQRDGKGNDRNLLFGMPTIRTAAPASCSKPRSPAGWSIRALCRSMAWANTPMGTPQYMSPEQAAGRLDLLGAASDVYSLGATLYYVLTGQPPIASVGIGTVLRKVQNGEFCLPRAVNPKIALPIEAICLKAMALKPADRYASPKGLLVRRFGRPPPPAARPPRSAACSTPGSPRSSARPKDAGSRRSSAAFPPADNGTQRASQKNGGMERKPLCRKVLRSFSAFCRDNNTYSSGSTLYDGMLIAVRVGCLDHNILNNDITSRK
jgi:serine/threonine protein kinase